MQTIQFKTNLRCESCVQKIAAFLDNETNISSWRVDLASPDKTLAVTAHKIDPAQIQDLVAKAGYVATLQEAGATSTLPPPSSPVQTYFPLILILGYLLLGVVLVEIRSDSWDFERMMGIFMGGFFLVFSFFKILNLTGFADAYTSYDLIAKRVRAYGFVYPFIELALGIGYLLKPTSFWLNVVTLAVMGISSLGVLQSLRRKQQIQCACLGTVFNLPMSSVTLVEDLLMVAMAAAMIASN